MNRVAGKKSLGSILFLSLGTLACGLLAGTPIGAGEDPLPVASPSSDPTSLPAATAAEIASSPEFDFDDLAPYRQAMLPEFAGDVDRVAAAGASRYYLQVSLEFPTGNPGGGEAVRLSGLEQVRYTNTEDRPLPEIYFRLYPNLPGYGGRMAVEQVRVDGRLVEPELASGGSALRVPLARPLAPGAATDLSLSYRAGVPAAVETGYNLFIHTGDTTALAGFYPAIAVYDDEGWNVEIPPAYGDATYLDVSLYRVQLTVPEEMVVAASGSLLAGQANADGTRTLSLVSGPMRDFYIAMRPDYRLASEVVDGVVVNSYYPPGQGRGGQLALRYAADALRIFNERFGKYPYAEFDVAATPTTAGGVEYPGIVIISRGLYDQTGGFFQHATAHEVAHQWWYGLVGNDQVDEPWLDESLTNYSAILYWEEAEGQAAAKRVVQNFFVKPYEGARARRGDRPVEGSVADFSEGDYGAFVYSKGPLFFEALRREVGDEIFQAIMQNYYSEYKYKIARPADLLEVIERVSGRDIEPLFEEWIQGR